MVDRTIIETLIRIPCFIVLTLERGQIELPDDYRFVLINEFTVQMIPKMLLEVGVAKGTDWVEHKYVKIVNFLTGFIFVLFFFRVRGIQIGES